MIAEDQVIKWAPGSRNVAAIVARWFGEYCVEYEVNNPLRIAAFLSQVMHESGSFRYLREIASGKAYEGRIDLGNVYPGDGVRYKGRGYIQITGRSNYMAVSKAFFGDNTLIDNPELLATPQYGMRSAFWYWDTRKLNVYADKQWIETITRRINGGLNGFVDRVHYYNAICEDLSLPTYVFTAAQKAKLGIP